MRNVDVLPKYDWHAKIYGGLSKQQIRDSTLRLLSPGFATVTQLEAVTDQHSRLTIEIPNALLIPNFEVIKGRLGQITGRQLSSISNTHKFVFNSWDTVRKKVDLHGYEPSKISPGTYSDIEINYLILDVYDRKKEET